MIRTRLLIQNVSITQMKKHKKKMFLRITSGNYSVLSGKHKIGKDGKVNFKEKFLITYYFAPPEDYLDRPKLHFSFRIERYDGTMTQKYGSQNISNLNYSQINSEKMYHLEFKLEKCKEDPFIACDISIYHNSKFALSQIPSNEIINKSLDVEEPEEIPKTRELSQDSDSDSYSDYENNPQKHRNSACMILMCLLLLFVFKLFYICVYSQNLLYEYQHSK